MQVSSFPVELGRHAGKQADTIAILYSSFASRSDEIKRREFSFSLSLSLAESFFSPSPSLSLSSLHCPIHDRKTSINSFSPNIMGLASQIKSVRQSVSQSVSHKDGKVERTWAAGRTTVRLSACLPMFPSSLCMQHIVLNIYIHIHTQTYYIPCVCIYAIYTMCIYQYIPIHGWKSKGRKGDAKILC